MNQTRLGIKRSLCFSKPSGYLGVVDGWGVYFRGFSNGGVCLHSPRPVSLPYRNLSASIVINIKSARKQVAQERHRKTSLAASRVADSILNILIVQIRSILVIFFVLGSLVSMMPDKAVLYCRGDGQSLNLA